MVTVNAKNMVALMILLSAFVFLSGCPQTGTQATGQYGVQTPPAQPANGAPSTIPPAVPPAAKTVTIEITSLGFSPNSIEINAGDTISFANKDANPHWPASAMHPTHAAYPEPGGCIGSKFDACKALSQGETFEFTFNQKGTWEYHDHLNPTLSGTIIVK